MKIVREELKQRREINVINYINSPIIGSLLIIVWEFIVKEMAEEIGVISAILPLIFLTLILSIIIGKIKKQCKEQKQFMNMFKRYSGYERLDQLLLYRMLRTGK